MKPVYKTIASPSVIYRGDVDAALEETSRLLDKVLAPIRKPVAVYFRADDIAVTDPDTSRLLDLFANLQVPLALALIPAWLTPSRWKMLRKWDDTNPHLWCWHTHGWRHLNHETAGKKSEFGPSRSEDAILSDLIRGMERMRALLKDRFCPVFTPPWNRCTESTLDSLEALGYRAVSRFVGASPAAPQGLTDLPASVDLHTRKEASANAGWQALFRQIQDAFQTGRCGFMIHHQRMNANAFRYLAGLLALLSHHDRIRLVSMQTLMDPAHPRPDG